MPPPPPPPPRPENPGWWWMEGGKRKSIATLRLAFGELVNLNWSSEERARLYVLHPPISLDLAFQFWEHTFGGSVEIRTLLLHRDDDGFWHRYHEFIKRSSQLIQPHADPEYACTAVRTGPSDVTSWIKIPSDDRHYESTYICEIPLQQRFTNQTTLALKIGYVACPYKMINIQLACIKK